jgi:hypothetical protein
MSTKSVEEVIPMLPIKSRLPNVNMSSLLKDRKSVSKRAISFDEARRGLPVGARISYVLWKLYEDRSGEQKYVYCNSAFYRGTMGLASYSLTEKKEIVTPVLVVASGGKIYQLSNDDIKELYVFEQQSDFCKKPKDRCEAKLRTKSKSLEHVAPTPAHSSRSKSLLH